MTEPNAMPRSVGVLGATITLIGFVVGITIFILPGALGATAGPAVILSYALAALLALFGCVVAAQVGSVFPVSGGSYVAIARLLNPFWGFTAVWMILGGVGVSVALLSYGFADYLQLLWPGVDRRVAAGGLVLLLSALNLFGIKDTIVGQAVMVVLFLIALGAFCVAGLINFQPVLLDPFMPNGVWPVLTAAIPAFFSYAGFMVIMELGGEIKNPGRTIPHALMWSFLIVVATYTLISLAVVGVIPWQELSGIEAPVAEAARRVLPPWAAQGITWAALAASASTVNVLLLGYSRDVLALAQANAFPSFMARTSRKHVPLYGVALISVISLLALCAEATVAQYATFVVLGLLLLQMLIGLAALLIPRRFPDLYQKSGFKLGGRSLAFFSLGLILLSIGFLFVEMAHSRKSVAVTLAYFLIGVFFYHARMKYLHRQVQAAVLIALGAMGMGWSSSLSADETVRATPQASDRHHSVYITMPDGVRLAAEIWLPARIDGAEHFPALALFTRYWRAELLAPPNSSPPANAVRMNAGGYAAVIVDVRGSGASFGSRATEYSVCETADFRHVIDWIAAQSWSNGRVATIGTSYVGNTAENATYEPSRALVAAVPRFTDFDLYSSLVYPGGLQNRIIAQDWGREVWALDRNKVVGQASGRSRVLGVKPVDEDSDGKLLAAAVAEHSANADVTERLAKVRFRDEEILASSIDGRCERQVTPYRFKDAVERQPIPTFHWASWMDAGTAAGVLARFASYRAPARYVIGPWTHGAASDADPFKSADTPVAPDVDEQYRQIFEFLAPYTFGGRNTLPERAELLYYTMGEGVWKRTDHWPPAPTKMVPWYFGAGYVLASMPPTERRAQDAYAVDFDAGSGTATRWSTQMGGTEVDYADRAAADRRLLTYTSEPLLQDIEITGHPQLELFVASTHADGAIIAYFEAIDPTGHVRMITEGELRLIHRRESTEPAPFPTFGPYHSYERKDSAPMLPGKMERVRIVLLPTSVLLRAGDRLRLAIAGHDKDTFIRFPAVGDPRLTISRERDHASRLLLPVIARPVTGSPSGG